MWKWRRRSDEDFVEEIRANIAIDTDRFIAEGMSPEEARRAALRAFGNVTRAQERAAIARRVGPRPSRFSPAWSTLHVFVASMRAPYWSTSFAHLDRSCRPR